MDFFKNIISHILGALIYKKGSLATASFFTSIFSVLGLNRLKTILFNKINTDESIINLFVGLIIFILIFVVIMFDNITGIMKAKAKQEVIEPKKGLIAIIKFIMYGFFIFLIMIFQLISSLNEWGFFTKTLTFILVWTGILINLWELKSIGRNIEIAFGKSYPLFNMIDKMIDIVEKSIIDRLRNSKFCK